MSFSPPFWKAFADTRSSIGNELGIDPNVILETSHGRRSIDVLKIISPEKANWDCELSPVTSSIPL